MLMGWAIGAFAFLLYLGTLSQHYSADSVLYALKIEGAQLGQIVDPTHVLIEPLGFGWYRLWQGLGWQSGSLVPLQVLNALAGGVSVGLLFGIVRRVSRSDRIGLAAAAGFAVSGGLWLLSVEAEFVTMPLAAALLVLWLLLAPPGRVADRAAAYPVILGLSIGLSILLFLNSVLLIPVAAAGLMLRQNNTWRVRIGQLAVMLLVLAVICVPAGVVLLKWREWSTWVNSIWQDGGSGYTTFTWLDVPHGGYTFLRSLGLFPGLALNESSRELVAEAGWGARLTFGAYYGVILLAALLPVYLAIKWRGPLFAQYRRDLTVLLIWSILYAIFALFWVPGDVSFWVPLLAAWWILVAIVVAAGASLSRIQGSDFVGRFAFARPGVALLLLVLLLGVTNLATVIWPRHDLKLNSVYLLTREIESQTSTRDLIVTAGDEIVTLYVLYFGRRTVLPVARVTDDPEAIVNQHLAILQDTWTKGGHAYLLDNERLVLLEPE